MDIVDTAIAGALQAPTIPDPDEIQHLRAALVADARSGSQN